MSEVQQIHEPDHSESIGELAKALAKAQSEFPIIAKNCEVKGTYRFTYADYGAITEAIKGPLHANGLAWTHLSTGGGVRTYLIHSSGEWISCTLPLQSRPLKPQELGSELTYLKRYGLSLVLGLATEDDEDGNLASGNTVEKTTKPAKGTSKPAAKPSGKGGLGKAHMDAINKAIESRAGEISMETSALLARICKKLDVKTIDLIPTERVGKLVVAVTKGEFDPAPVADDDIPF